MTTSPTTDSTSASVFHLQAPLLDQGRTMDLLARADVLAAHIKIYAEGGENAMHAHAAEEHLFVILAGEATFHLGLEDDVRVLRAHDGVLIPQGGYYWFVSSGDENLVLLRVGAKRDGWSNFDDRVDVDGRPFAGDSAANKEQPVIVREGAYFGRRDG